MLHPLGRRLLPQNILQGYFNMTKLQNQAAGQILQDASSTGRVRPWRDKKLNNLLLAQIYDAFDTHKAGRLRSCANYLNFQSIPIDGKRLVDASFCRVRLCPICAWRRTLKVYSCFRKILVAMRPEGYRYIFVTLTVRNCTPQNLSETIDGMMHGWNRLAKYKAFKQAVNGWYRALEITHNVDLLHPELESYHPHFHCIFAVSRSYFTSQNYLSQAKWTTLWQKALDASYTPIVDVRRVKGTTAKAVAEAAKYTVKDSDYLIPDDWDLTTGTVQLLDDVLHNRRLIAYGGAMKDWHQKLNLDDEIDGDLVHVDDDATKEIEEVGYPVIAYVWGNGISGQNYYAH